MEHLWKSNWLGNDEVLGEKLTLCHFGHGKVYLRCSGRQNGRVPQDPGDDELCEIWYDCYIYKNCEFTLIRDILL
jgi:hypothetical protein